MSLSGTHCSDFVEMNAAAIRFCRWISCTTNRRKNHLSLNLPSVDNPRRISPTEFLRDPSESQQEHYSFARICQSLDPTHLPSSARVFDDLLSSTYHVAAPPNTVSSFFTTIATLISVANCSLPLIRDLISGKQLSLVCIDEQNPDYNTTTSFLDLSPLYGTGQAGPDRIRAHDGRGMLTPDCFVDNRVALYPPAVGVLLILFNRNHNVSSAPRILV
jgi:hypothetical protein